MNTEIVTKPKSRNLIGKDLHIPDPYEIILLYFETTNREPPTTGTSQEFQKKAFYTILVCIALQFFFIQLFPGILAIIITPIILWYLCKAIITITNKVNAQQSAGSILGMLFIMMILAIVVGQVTMLLNL